MLRPSIFSNETVYGWLTRRHLTRGVGHSENTLSSLLGSKKVRIHPYLPNHLSALAENTKLSADHWLYEHTLYPLFSFFCPERASRLKAAMLGVSNNVVSLAGIPQSRLLFKFGHRYCPECIADARLENGFGVLDIRHQIPSVMACTKHRCALNLVQCGDFGVDRSLTYSLFDTDSIPAEAFQVDFSQFCIDAFEIIRANSHLSYQEDMYRYHLRCRGYLTKNGQLKVQSILDSLSQFYMEFPFVNGFEPISKFKFLGSLLRNKTRMPVHPVKHLFFAFWLFEGDASQFSIVRCNTSNDSVENTENRDVDSKILELISEGKSMECVHGITGKSRCYIRRVCELHGIEHSSNQNAHSELIRNKVISMAELGRNRQEIAEELSLGIGYVEQVISNTPGLVAHRKRLWILRKVRSSYRELRRARKIHPDWIRKDFKQIHNQAFFYLYRNARRLLESVLPAKLRARGTKFDWAKEDERLYEAISKMKKLDGLSISALGHHVQDHGHLRRNLKRLTKTKKLLRELNFL